LVSARGWALIRALALVLVVVFLSPISPLVLVCVPLAILLVAYRAKRFGALFPAAVLLGFVFSVAPTRPEPLWFAERAWALLLAGGFVLAGLWIDRRCVMARSVTAVAIAGVVVVATGVLKPVLLAELDWHFTANIGAAAQTARAWMETGGPGLVELATAVQTIVGVQIMLYPALLSLASLAALGVAWYVVNRLGGEREALAPLRDFRFSDQLVWLLVGGLVLFLLPTGELADRLGENAVAFMGGLYALRGVAIMVWVVTAAVTSAWGAALWSVAAVLLYPVVLGVALVMGLSDTWLDLRARLQTSRDGT
jgi:hypothetical protein